MQLEDLTRPPFGLDRAAVAWVEATLDGLDPAARVAQLFNLGSWGEDPGEAERLRLLRPGGITRRPGADAAAERRLVGALQEQAQVPLLVSADLEGSRMSLPFGTKVPNPLALAAIDDVGLTREISRIMAREGRAAGINWSFTPVLDINAAFRSAIVATRGFGSDPDRIRRHALAQIEEFQGLGIAATAKHWPGEGYDDRDQHLVTTINPLSVEDWHATFGALYRAAIEAGVMAVMSAHIALPAYARAAGAEGAEAFRPASISSLLNTRLLREELGFGGLIVSDASEMAGLTSWAPPRTAKAELIAQGCDMILFASEPEAEMAQVLDAVRSGGIPAARFDAAVMRVLGLKAALGLHRARLTGTLADIGRPEDARTAAAALRRAPTLVKDVQRLLPLDPARHRRVLVISGGVVEPLQSRHLPLVLPDLLAAEGFEITLYSRGMDIVASDHDLILYLFGEETLLTRGRIFLDWLGLTGDFRQAMKRYWHDVPTALISFGYPYYLYDAPRMPTVINAYSTLDEMQAAVCELLLGRAPWNRLSPVDPFAGAADAAF